MYAPKFKSWLSDEERFRAVLHRMIDERCEEARAECAQMVSDAMKPLQCEDETAKVKAMNQATYLRMRSLQNACAQFSGMANIRSQFRGQDALNQCGPYGLGRTICRQYVLI